MNDVIGLLMKEPSLAWKVTVNILGKPANSTEARQAAERVRGSKLVTAMLAARDTSGHAYRKWTGSHWLLSLLADLGYPAGDETIRSTDGGKLRVLVGRAP